MFTVGTRKFCALAPGTGSSSVVAPRLTTGTGAGWLSSTDLKPKETGLFTVAATLPTGTRRVCAVAPGTGSFSVAAPRLTTGTGGFSVAAPRLTTGTGAGWLSSGFPPDLEPRAGVEGQEGGADAGCFPFSFFAPERELAGLEEEAVLFSMRRRCRPWPTGSSSTGPSRGILAPRATGAGGS